MRIALLANPDSGSGDAGDIEPLLRESGAEVSRFRLDRASEAIDARPQRIVVAGGDGSIGTAAEVAAGARIPLGASRGPLQRTAEIAMKTLRREL